MIDYVPLLLINMVSALVVLAFFLWWGLGREDTRHWAPAFGISGLVATVAGFAMTFTWPIPAPFSTAYGEMSVLLGVLFLGATWAIACGWNLLPLGIYAFFAGLAAIVIGVRFIHLSLTPMPSHTRRGFHPDRTRRGLCLDRAMEAGYESSAPRGRTGPVGGRGDLGVHRGHGLLESHEGSAAGRNHHLLGPPIHLQCTGDGSGKRDTHSGSRPRSLLSAAQVSGTARGTAVKLASAAIRQYMQNPRYHAH